MIEPSLKSYNIKLRQLKLLAGKLEPAHAKVRRPWPSSCRTVVTFTSKRCARLRTAAAYPLERGGRTTFDSIFVYVRITTEKETFVSYHVMSAEGQLRTTAGVPNSERALT